MDTFFFIAKKGETLHKIYFKCVLVNLENINYLDSIKNYYNILTSSLKQSEKEDSSESIKKLYIYNVNKEFIYFPHQIANIDFLKSSEFDQSQIRQLYVQSSIFFKNTSFESFDENSVYFDKYKYVMNPDLCLQKLNYIISYCFEKLNFIETNYEIIAQKDLENIRHKNKLINSLSVLEMKNISDYPKKREKVDYLLFDLDLEITNILISSLNIKYNRLSKDNILEICELLSNLYSQTKNIEKFINENIDNFETKN